MGADVVVQNSVVEDLVVVLFEQCQYMTNDGGIEWHSQYRASSSTCHYPNRSKS